MGRTERKRRPFLHSGSPIKLLESNALPYHKTGKHRRVRFFDLMRYNAERDQASADAMEALSRQAQALGMGYE